MQHYIFFILVGFVTCLFYLQPITQGKDINERETFRNIMNEVEIFSEVHGYPPTMNDCFSFLQKIKQDEIDNSTFGIIYKIVLQQQQPIITTRDLLKIFITKRDSLHSYIVKYKTEIVVFGQNGVVQSSQLKSCEFAKSKDKFLIDVEDLSSSKKIRYRRSYDGNKLINLRTSEHDIIQAGIASANTLGHFFDPYMPLVRTGFFDTKSCGISHAGYDMAIFLKGDFFNGKKFSPPHVFEKIEIIDGQKCLAVSNNNRSVFFDIEKDYSVLQYEKYRSIVSNSMNGPVLIGRYLVSRTKLYDWFFMKMVYGCLEKLLQNILIRKVF
jgi:hypothetical protein